jgi:hypothetical protein
MSLSGPFGTVILPNVPVSKTGDLLISGRGSSLLSVHRHTLTWMGDAELAIWCLSVSFLRLLKATALLFAFGVIWRSTSDLGQRSFSPRPISMFTAARDRYSEYSVTILLSILLFLMFSIFSFAEWPGLHWDAWLFAPAVINAAKGNSWNCGVYPATADLFLSGVHDFHGFSSILVFGSFLRCETWPAFVRCLLISDGLTSVLWFLTGRAANRKCGNNVLAIPFLIGVMAGVIAVGLHGRPEYLVVAFTAIPVLIWSYSSSSLLHFVATAFTSGLCFVTSPQAGVLSSLGIAILVACKRSNPKLQWIRFAAVGFGSLLVAFLLTTSLAPFSFFRWFSRVKYSSDVALDFSSHLFRLDLDSLFGISMVAPFWNLIVLFHACAFFCCLFRLRQWLSVTWLAGVGLFLLPRLTDYGYTFAFPCLLTIITPLQSKLSVSEQMRKNFAWYRRFLFPVLLMYVVAWGQFAGEAFAVFRTGRTLSVCHQQLQSFMSEILDTRSRLGQIGFLSTGSCSGVVLGDASDRYVLLIPDPTEGSWSEKVRYFFSRSGGPPDYLICLPDGPSPAEMLKFEDDVFDRVMLSGPAIENMRWTLKRRRIGHEFAVYKRRI